MPKYLITWETDPNRVPLDPKERGALWSGMVAMVKQQMKDGITIDWGAFAGESRGYAIGENSAVELSKLLQQFYPYITFETHDVMTIDEMGEVAKSLQEG
jgi:hypothetical protein